MTFYFVEGFAFWLLFLLCGVKFGTGLGGGDAGEISDFDFLIF